MHSRGGLHTLFSMVLGGLVAATPHMIAATVMALARLLYEFAGPLEYMVDDLLPAVLALLRTKSREVVKAVLGFVKVLGLYPCVLCVTSCAYVTNARMPVTHASSHTQLAVDLHPNNNSTLVNFPLAIG